MIMYRRSENFGRRRLPNVFNKKQLISLVDNINNPFILMAVFGAFTFGLRISEVVKLRKTDFNFEDKKIKITKSKFDRDRYIDIIKDEWVSIYRKWFNLTKNSDYVFPRDISGEPISKMHLYNTYFNYLKKSKLAISEFTKKNNRIHHAYVFHTLRHSFCTYLIQKGMPINDVQRLMGHSDINITLRYLHISDNDRRSKIDEIFNKGKKELTPQNTEVNTQPLVNINPLRLLQLKLVNGEITEQEYNRKLELLNKDPQDRSQ